MSHKETGDYIVRINFRGSGELLFDEFYNQILKKWFYEIQEKYEYTVCKNIEFHSGEIVFTININDERKPASSDINLPSLLNIAEWYKKMTTLDIGRIDSNTMTNSLWQKKTKIIQNPK